MIVKKLTLTLLHILAILTSFSQTKDSLKLLISNSPNDTVKVNLLLEIANTYEENNNDSTIHYYNSAIATSKEIKSKSKEAESLVLLANYYFRDNKYTNAIKYYNSALVIYISLKNKSKEAQILQNIGIAYYYKGDLSNSLEILFSSLKNYEELNDTVNIAQTMSKIGNVYDEDRKYSDALEFHKKSLKLDLKINHKLSQAADYNNIGNAYLNLEGLEKALIYYKKSLQIYEEQNSKSGIARALGNIGVVYSLQEDDNSALVYYKKALSLYTELGRKRDIALNYGNIADTYLYMNKYYKSIEYSKKCLDISIELESISNQLYSYWSLYKAYYKLKDYKNAITNLNKYHLINDSLYNVRKSKDLEEIKAKYESEKSKEKINLQNLELKKNQIEIDSEKTQRRIYFYASIIMLVLVLFSIWSYIQKHKAHKDLKSQKAEVETKNNELQEQSEELKVLNQNLHEQNDEIDRQKKLVEDTHKEIEQSIEYAKNLQHSILPEKEILDKYLSDSFVFFKPKDKVSGDFYWWAHVEGCTVITAADSTGHGVPGAFMSLLGTSFLREIVQKEYITHTGVILRKLRKEIIKVLKQTGKSGTHKDGMDMALISINHETNIVQFSGANNPLYIITANKRSLQGIEPLAGFKGLYEIKPDKMPIAIYEKMDRYTTHEVQLEKGDQLYMFSDGYPDQFGGPKGKKFKYKPFKKLLLDNASKTMSEQKELLNNSFETWKNNLEQVDDVLVLGIRI